MRYSIQLFRDGEPISKLPSERDLEGTKNLARKRLRSDDADFVRILDTEKGDAEVWSLRNDASEA